MRRRSLNKASYLSKHFEFVSKGIIDLPDAGLSGYQKMYDYRFNRAVSMIVDTVQNKIAGSPLDGPIKKFVDNLTMHGIEYYKKTVTAVPS